MILLCVQLCAPSDFPRLDPCGSDMYEKLFDSVSRAGDPKDKSKIIEVSLFLERMRSASSCSNRLPQSHIEDWLGKLLRNIQHR